MKIEDFFTIQIPKNIKLLLNEILGKVYNEGQFYSPTEVSFMNKIFRNGSDIKSGICVGQSGNGEYLFIDSIHGVYNLYSLTNGDQGYRAHYTHIFEISTQDTPNTFIEKVNQYYELRYNKLELKTDNNRSKTTLEFISELPNGVKDLLIIKKEFGIIISIHEIKLNYLENKKLEIDCPLSKSRVLIRRLPTELINCIKLK